MQLRSDSFTPGGRIPAEFAFGKPGDAASPIALSDNRNPHLAWDAVPEVTRSFALLCVDPDAPTVADTVNRADATVPHDQPRAPFVHWTMADLPADLRSIAAGACSQGVTAHGKRAPAGPAGSRQGLNDYTGWFAGDADMAGDYVGYDGPCPPFNDERVHRYVFRLFALDIDRLELPARFTAADLERAIDGHVLAEASVHGVYAINAGAR